MRSLASRVVRTRDIIETVVTPAPLGSPRLGLSAVGEKT